VSVGTPSPSATAVEHGAVHVEAVMTRVRLADAEIERLQALCRERPTVLVALQSDAFLARVPEAVARVSACDATPLTRRAVARRIAGSACGPRT